MLEDLRNHDAKPTDEEREWMRTNPFAVAIRLVVLAAIAAAIGLGVSQPPVERPTAVAASAP